MQSHATVRMVVLVVLASIVGSVMAQDFGAPVQHFAQICLGGGATTLFSLHNPSAEGIQVEIQLYAAADGTSLQVQTVDVPAGGVATATFGGAEGTLTVGWARLVSSRPFAATEFFQIKVGDQELPRVGVMPSSLSPRIKLFAFAKQGETQTGIALANPGDGSAAVTVHRYNTAGTETGSANFTLGPRQQLARFLNEAPLFPGLVNFEGILEVEANAPVVALMMRSDSNLLSAAPVLTPGMGQVAPGSVTTEALVDSAVTNSKIAVGAITKDKVAPGQLVTSLNGLTDDIQLAQGANVTITQSGQTLTIATTSSGTGGLSLPYTGSLSVPTPNAVFSLANTGTGQALHGKAGIFEGYLGYSDGGVLGGVTGGGNYGYLGRSNAGVYGYANSGRGVWGESSDAAGVYGVSTVGDGIVGISSTAAKSGIYGTNSNTSGYGVLGRNTTSGTYGYMGGAYGVYGTGNAARGVMGESNSVAGVFGKSTSGSGVIGSSTSGWGVSGMSQSNDGMFGQTDATNKSGVWGDATDGYGVSGTSTNNSGVYAVTHSTDANTAALWARNAGAGPALRAVAGSGGYAAVMVGRTSTQILEITGGSDLSEQFEIRETADQALEPGMVVSIDPTKEGRLVLAHQAYDHSVAGVISGAGGIRTGLLMGQNGSPASGHFPVALSGRVYCWADASFGAIHPGDLLTTSDTPGHAMRVGDPGRAQGAILGKAMSALSSGQGLIFVLVTLQ